MSNHPNRAYIQTKTQSVHLAGGTIVLAFEVNDKGVCFLRVVQPGGSRGIDVTREELETIHKGLGGILEYLK